MYGDYFAILAAEWQRPVRGASAIITLATAGFMLDKHEIEHMITEAYETKVEVNMCSLPVFMIIF